MTRTDKAMTDLSMPAASVTPAADTTRRRKRSPFASVTRFAFTYWRKEWRLACLTGGAMMAATFMDILIPLYAGRLVDAVSLGRSEAALAAALDALGAIAGLGLLALATRFLSFFGIVRFTLAIMSRLVADSFWRVQRFATDWHANTFAGSTVRKITRGMWAMDSFDDTLLLALLPAAVVLAGSSLILAWHWPLMGLLVLAGSVFYVTMVVTLALKYIGPAAALSNQWDTKLGGVLADSITCNAIVKSFGAEAREDALLSRIIAKWKKRSNRSWMRMTVNGIAQGSMLLIFRIVIIGMALLLWWEGSATPGEVVYVLTAYLVIHGYLHDIGYYIRDLQRSVNDMEELVAIHEAPFGVKDSYWARPIAITRGEIAFDRVTFHYAGHETPLYRDFSLTIRAGEKVGLVGLSGSGKTTFVKLIQRLYDIQGGEIRIDGQNIAAAAQSSLRSQIALVQQEPILFHRSLAENIAYARPGATMAEIERAARLANAHEFIARLPKGYGTLVGERGVKLSGGERQRVALARAFLADAPILILYEATSSLDSESEHLIQEATARLIEGRTAIVIAHRLSTVRALERILIFDRGQVVEEGSHSSLLAKEDGIYRRLFDRQVLGLIDEDEAA